MIFFVTPVSFNPHRTPCTLRPVEMTGRYFFVIGAICESLLDARDSAYKDYERTGMRSSQEMTKAWQADAEIVSAVHKVFLAQQKAGMR